MVRKSGVNRFMKDEIKEILNDMKIMVEDNDDLFRLDLTLNKEDVKILLDYITNLQKENEVLKDKLDIFILSDKTKQETIDKFRDRIDKVIEYIKDLCTDVDGTIVHYGDGTDPNFILNTLKGEENNE